MKLRGIKDIHLHPITPKNLSLEILNKLPKHITQPCKAKISRQTEMYLHIFNKAQFRIPSIELNWTFKDFIFLYFLIILPLFIPLQYFRNFITERLRRRKTAESWDHFCNEFSGLGWNSFVFFFYSYIQKIW